MVWRIQNQEEPGATSLSAQQFQSYDSQHNNEDNNEVRGAGQVTSGALWLAGLDEFALQKHSGNTKPLLLVDRLSQDVVVRNRPEARFLKQPGEELCEQTRRADWDFSGTTEREGWGGSLCNESSGLMNRAARTERRLNLVQHSVLFLFEFLYKQLWNSQLKVNN